MYDLGNRLRKNVEMVQNLKLLFLRLEHFELMRLGWKLDQTRDKREANFSCNYLLLFPV